MDKVQKIKDWISKEQEGLMDAQGNFEYPEHEGAYHILCNLDAYIDSLQEEHVSDDSWKPADGNDLPEYEREVIVLYQPSNLELEKTEYCVSFAHRPNPKGWDGKSMLTGKIENYTPKTYGKGGWNIPDVKWWLDLDFPNES